MARSGGLQLSALSTVLQLFLRVGTKIKQKAVYWCKMVHVSGWNIPCDCTETNCMHIFVFFSNLKYIFNWWIFLVWLDGGKMDVKNMQMSFGNVKLRDGNVRMSVHWSDEKRPPVLSREFWEKQARCFANLCNHQLDFAFRFKNNITGSSFTHYHTDTGKWQRFLIPWMPRVGFEPMIQELGDQCRRLLWLRYLVGQVKGCMEQFCRRADRLLNNGDKIGSDCHIEDHDERKPPKTVPQLSTKSDLHAVNAKLSWNIAKKVSHFPSQTSKISLIGCGCMYISTSKYFKC